MKNKISILFFFFISLAFYAFSQPNLVPNYSFEQKIKCVNWGNEFTGYVAYWTGQEGWGGGLAWFTAGCDSGGVVWVPINYMGHQYARTGISYAGITSYLDFYSCVLDHLPTYYCLDYRNYIEVMLNNPLKTGVKYCITFYVSLSDTSKYACNDIGAYLSDSALYNDMDFGNNVKDYITPQIANDPVNNPLTDKIGWTKVQGDFVAAGGEKYIVIGNFKDDANSSIDSIGSTGPNTYPDAMVAYYYIDDVYVLTPVYAHAGRDTNICNGGQALIGEDSAQQGVSYYWQPTTGLAEPNSPQTLASPSVTTTYTLTVVNDSMQSCGCDGSTNSSTVTVNVCPVNLYVPNAFSPNNDGYNDVLLVRGNFIQTFYMAIYDRWGNKVFESNNINEGWDGKYKGQPENTGTYVYYLKGTYDDGTGFEKKGNVAIVR